MEKKVILHFVNGTTITLEGSNKEDFNKEDFIKALSKTTQWFADKSDFTFLINLNNITYIEEK